jgi:hypothetical protein
VGKDKGIAPENTPDTPHHLANGHNQRRARQRPGGFEYCRVCQCAVDLNMAFGQWKSTFFFVPRAMP